MVTVAFGEHRNELGRDERMKLVSERRVGRDCRLRHGLYRGVRKHTAAERERCTADSGGNLQLFPKYLYKMNLRLRKKAGARAQARECKIT